jgi:hypothetical protein
MLLKHLLYVMEDASVLAAIGGDARGLTRDAESGLLLERIPAEMREHDRTSLVEAIPESARAEIAERLGSAANAADFIDGQGWDAVIRWGIDIARPSVGDIEL